MQGKELNFLEYNFLNMIGKQGRSKKQNFIIFLKKFF